MVLRETHFRNVEYVKKTSPNTTFIAVSRYLPRDSNGHTYNSCDEWDTILAPSSKLLRAYKNGEVNWPMYMLAFHEEMQTDEAQGSMWILAQKAVKQDICLACFEGLKDGEKCHRFLLLDIISKIAKNNGINLQVKKAGKQRSFAKSKSRTKNRN